MYKGAHHKETHPNVSILYIIVTVNHIDWHNTFNTLRPRQNGRHFADDIFKCIFLTKMFEFQLKFHSSLFLRVQLTIFQHWFR